MMASVVKKINELGIAVEHIPGGCTGLVQPIDVGIGKPLKNRVRRLWNEWMVAKDKDDAYKPPEKPLLAKWIIDGLNDLPKQLIRNSWRHHDFGYFKSDLS